MSFVYGKSINYGSKFKINIYGNMVGYSWENKPGKKDQSSAPMQCAAQYEELLSSIKTIKRANFLSTILILTVILSFKWYFILTGILGILLKIFVHVVMPVHVEYAFDEAGSQRYQRENSVWMCLGESKYLWEVTSIEKISDVSVNAGASQGIKRTERSLTDKMPYFVKLNIKPVILSLDKNQIIFLPDKIWYLKGKRVKALNYRDLTLSLGITHFVETEVTASDARLIKYTWLGITNTGKRDKRYINNQQVPVYEYGEIIFDSGRTLHVKLMCSNGSLINKMRNNSFQDFGYKTVL